KQADAAIPLHRQRLRVMLEANQNALAEMIDRADAVELDVELKDALQRLGPFGPARVGPDLAAPLDRERSAGKHVVAGRHLTQHFAVQRDVRTIDEADTDARAVAPHLVDRLLRDHDADDRPHFADDIAEQLALAIEAPRHVLRLRRDEDSVGL